MPLKKNFYNFFSIFFLSVIIYAQTDKSNSIVVIPQVGFSAGTFHQLFFGEHWRNLWTTPVEFPVLDLRTFSGGLTPTERGGGLQTKSLRFVDKNGTIWKFRSITKDPSKVLPPDLRETIADEIMFDQISSANPYGALVANYLLDAVEILNAKPALVYLPDDDLLGEFKNDYGNIPGFIEIHPAEMDSSSGNFGGADKIVGTYKLYERLEKERDEKVDAAEYLKARLMDCLIGDWDRHNDQWRWARYTIIGNKLWKPIPRDRDQVFPKFDGLLPWVSTFYVLQFCNFDGDYPAVRKLTWNGRYPDQRILPALIKTEWDSVTMYVQSKITDEVIYEAVKQLPAEVYHLAKEEIESQLISRRNLLKDFSDRYFDFINNVVDLYCTTKDDYVEVNRKSNHLTEISFYKKDKVTDTIKGERLFHRTFDNNVTDEIRIYMLDGDDKVLVKGGADCNPMIRVIGDEGEDQFVDSSKVQGYFLDITPIKDAEEKTYFYDSGKKSKFITGAGTVVDKTEWHERKNESTRYEQNTKDRHSEWFTYPLLNYNKDNGIYFGFNSRLYFYDFRMEPFDSWISFSPSYAANSESFNFSVEAQSNSLVKNSRAMLKIEYTEMFLSKYFGYGNETLYNEELIKNDYNRLNQSLFRLEPSINFNLIGKANITFGFSLQYFHTSLSTNSLLINFPYGKYGIGRLWMLGIKSEAGIDTRDNVNHPLSGYLFNIKGNFFPELFDTKASFVKGGIDFRFYRTYRTITDITFAFRASGEKIFGQYPFIHSAFVGGENNLRGYNRERFSGESSIFAQSEIRTHVAKVKVILPSNFGLNLFYELGRVYSKLESNKLHASYGFGFWLSYLNRALTLSFTTAFSKEEEYYYFDTRTGF